ncbi:MAG: hypothetical protein ACI81S_001898 [Sphingobacteriales bacterium]
MGWVKITNYDLPCGWLPRSFWSLGWRERRWFNFGFFAFGILPLRHFRLVPKFYLVASGIILKLLFVPKKDEEWLALSNP